MDRAGSNQCPTTQPPPEYRAWVEAKRTAVEAQRVDPEAGIRRLEQSLEAAIRSWRTRWGKLSVGKKTGHWSTTS